MLKLSETELTEIINSLTLDEVKILLKHFILNVYSDVEIPISIVGFILNLVNEENNDDRDN